MKNLFKLLNYFFSILAFSFILVSCSDDDDNQGFPFDPKDSGVLILNQGGWGQNNAGLSLYEPKDSVMTLDIFNGRLGETAQDMIIYGSKLYISVAGSKLISVVDMKTLKEISQVKTDLELDDNSKLSLEPYFFTAKDNKIYFTTQDPLTGNGYILKIDTLSLKIENLTQVGTNPVGIAEYGNKLYVANSGFYPNFDNTMSIVDLETFKEEEKMTVGLNPSSIASNGNGKLYLIYKGDYTPENPGGFQIINTHSKKIETDNYEYPVQNLVITNNILYLYDSRYENSSSIHNGVLKYDLQTNKYMEEPAVSPEKIEGTPYALNVHPVTKEIYLATSITNQRGKMHIFNSKGELEIKESAGIYPCKILFY